METQQDSPESPARLTPSDRLSHVGHMQTLRWAYLSTYLLSVGWFLSLYFQKDSTLASSKLGSIILIAALVVLGFFLALRIYRFTYLIRHDLDTIGTPIRGQGWIEYTFAFLTVAAMFLFGILVLLGILPR